MPIQRADHPDTIPSADCRCAPQAGQLTLVSHMTRLGIPEFPLCQWRDRGERLKFARGAASTSAGRAR
ncbi:hypothetical protein D9M69_198440 [compost metagenome]